MTKVIKAFPPNFVEIAKAFPWIKGQPHIVYAYYPNIYNPSGGKLSPWIIAHEEVHLRQQGVIPKEWWNLYFTVPEWRLLQEIPAHMAEWESYKKLNGARHSYLDSIANRLSGPLYGNLISYTEAMRAIQ